MHTTSPPNFFKPTGMFINGSFVQSQSSQSIDVQCPATKEIIAKVPRANEIDVNLAVEAAEQAFYKWKKLPPKERGKILLKIADAMEARVEELATTVALDTGNAIRTQARPEAYTSIDIFRYFGGLALELKGETLPLGENTLSYTIREPLGVVGAIIPWNAPLSLGSLKIAPALCAGNTIVMKAAEDAPLAMLILADIASQFLPPGVLNILTGYGQECGSPLCNHPKVRKLTFTGSTAVGKTVMHAAAERIVPVSLELGGKSPSIVFPDANEDFVVDGIIKAMRFERQSQSCTAGSRLFLHEDIFDSFVVKLQEKALKLKIGHPLDETVDMGSIINQKQFDKVCHYISDGLENKNASLIFGGLPPSSGPMTQGYFTIPTLFKATTNNWRLAQEEIFGPVLVAIAWKDESDVIKMANDSHYGLAAYIWTHNIAKGIKTAHQIDSGWIQVNQGLGQVVGMSYGGYKQSGIGKEFSLEGMLDHFTQRKNVTINLIN